MLGPEHPDTLTCRNNLAGAYRANARPGVGGGRLRRLLRRGS